MNYLDAQVNKIRELKTELKNQHEENARLLLQRSSFPQKNVSLGNTRDLNLFYHMVRSSTLIKMFFF